jgi:integrase/recombinase XerC
MSAQQRQAHYHGYLQNLATQRRLSPHTVEGYRRDLAELERLVAAAFAPPAAAPALEALDHFHIRKFASQMHGAGLHPRSIARRLSAWRGFFNWLSEQLPLAANPVDGVRPPKRGKPLPKALSADDAVQLVSNSRPGRDPLAPDQLCDRAMFELLYSSGLRVSELVSLDAGYVQEDGYTSPGWIDYAGGEVTVTGKGSKKRVVPVGAAALDALRAWLTVRPQLLRADAGADTARHALFLSLRGKRMTPRMVQVRIKAHALALGIPTDVHPHVLRHSFASHVLQSSGDLRAVQEMLGHASISSTQVYTSLDFQRLAQVYDAAHPRARKRDA